MQVDDRSLQGPVAEPALHGLYVLAGLQKVRGIAVAECVRREGSVQPGLLQLVFQALTDVGIVYRDDKAAVLLEYQVRTPETLVVYLEYLQRLGRDGHDAVLAALASADEYLPAVERDVIPAQLTCLEGAQPAVVDDGEQCLGVQVAGAEQLLNLFHGQHPRKSLLTAYLRKSQACQVWIPHGMQVALQSVDEVLELRDGRLRLTGQQVRQVAVSILLGELLRELPDVDHRLVQCVTVVNDSTGRMSGDLQLALKERNSVGEGRYLGQCDVGDPLRHNNGEKGC